LQMPEGLTPDAGYRGGNSGAPASSGNEVKAVDISPSAMPPSFDAGKPAKPSASQGGNPTSRYFDLNRFDKEDVAR